MKTRSLLKVALFFLLLSGEVWAQNPCYFTIMPGSGPTNTFHFIPSVSYPAPQYFTLWSFGDGQTGTDSFPTHTYNAPGNYLVCRSVYDSLAAGALVCQYCDTLVVAANPACSFTYAISPPGSNTVVFTGNSSTQGSYIYWYIVSAGTIVGPGSVYTYTFPAAGNYTVIMREEDSTGGVLCIDTNVVFIPNVPSCYFIDAPDSVQQNTVNFASYFSGWGGNYVVWSFGDGSYDSTSSFVSHTYSIAGSYTVCMNVMDSLGVIACTYCDSVVVGSGQGGNCSFSVIPDSTNNYLFYFNALVSPSASVTWDFGDGNTGSGINTFHLYNANAIFTVVMTVIDSNGTCTYSSSVSTGSVVNQCVITYIPDSMNSQLVYFFANPFPGGNIVWSFGDSTTGSGNFVSHQYAQPGTYTVCMTALDSGQNVICTSCETIVVNGPSPNCTAYYLATSLGLTGYFIDLSNFDPATSTYYWSFGDNTISTSRFPQHTYASPGTYNVCLTVAGTGCANQYCASITVDTLINSPTTCQAYFAKLQLAPYQVTIVNLSNGINLNFNWDFGDGGTSNQPYPSHVYASTGTYVLCLTVSDTTGCTSTYCDTLTVDSMGNVSKGASSFILNVLSPSQITGVEDLGAQKQFEVYPNPVNSELVISLSKDFGLKSGYKIFALDGKEIMSGNLNREKNVIVLEILNHGIYILEVNDSDGFSSHRKIIKN